MAQAKEMTALEWGLLLGLSVSIGGVIERAEIMSLFPQSFASPWAAMVLMVLVLVVLGMIMDAFGAVILVSATVASIASKSRSPSIMRTENSSGPGPGVVFIRRPA